MFDKRLVFDTIPEQFDRRRCRYSPELFSFIVSEFQLDSSKSCLELGPGTGQATDFALDACCDYTAIELGANLADFMRRKYGDRPNFKIINADFETYDFGDSKFDLIYSAAAIQWIQEDIAYKKSFDLLREGGYLAMFLTHGDYSASDPSLHDDIQKVYDKYFVSDSPYRQRFNYGAATDYGFADCRTFEFHGQRVMTTDEYIDYIGTHSDHITLNEHYRDDFYNGMRAAVDAHGGRIVFDDTYRLYLCRK